MYSTQFDFQLSVPFLSPVTHPFSDDPITNCKFFYFSKT